MLLVKCQCGHEMQVSDAGEPRNCPKCRGTVQLTGNGVQPTQKNGSNGNGKSPDNGVNPAHIIARGVGVDKKRIGELLLEANLISSPQLAHALEIQARKGAKVVETLIDLGYLSVESFVHFLSGQPGVASIDLSNYQIPKEFIDLVPKEIAIKHEVFPIDRMGKLLTLGMACPLDSATVRRIEERTGLRVKALLCSAADIRKAIRQYYPLDDEDYYRIEADSAISKRMSATSVKLEPPVEVTGIRLHRVAKLVRELKSLPALPATVQKVRDAMIDLDIAPNEVAEIIQHDPPIAAKVLSVANSAAYGFLHQVATVQLAVSLMGLRETYSIVLSAAVLNLFDKSSIFDYKRYWEEAMNSAAAARIVAKACGRQQNHSVFTAGLLHDIGRVALLETVPELYAKVSPTLQAAELVAEEERIIGLSHAEAGYQLAQQWNLPPEISEPIRFHHTPEFATDHVENVCMVALAEAWTRVNDARPSPTEAQLREWTKAFRVLGMDAAAAAAAYEEAAQLEKIRFDWSAQSSMTERRESVANRG